MWVGAGDELCGVFLNNFIIKNDFKREGTTLGAKSKP